MLTDTLSAIRANSSSDLDALVHMWNEAEYLACELNIAAVYIYTFLANVASSKGIALTYYV